MRATLTAEAPYPKQSCFFSDSDAKKVLVAARDLIHLGWKLVHHPLYGNYRPHQQPYRSILLQFCNQTNPDSASLQLIEAALGVYSADRVLDPRQVPDVMLKDCSLLDYELIRLPMEQTGWIVA